ncbi:TPA: hypothetical protein ACNH1M_001198 [Enterobacter cloacae]
MSKITKERIEQFANDPMMCVSDEVRELARIALASLEAEPVMNEIVIPEPATHRNINEICPPGVNQTLYASGWNASRKSGMNSGRIPPIVKGIDAECMGWNACRDAMLQGVEPVTTANKLPELTDSQCLEFLAVAFRHASIKGDIEFDDIRLGLRMALEAAPRQEVK